MSIIVLCIFVAIFFIIHIIKCDLANRLVIPIGLFGAFATSCWIWQQTQNEEASFLQIAFLIFIPLVSSYAWNEKLYHSLINEFENLENIITYCGFRKFGLFLFSILLFAMGRLCFITA